MSFARAACFGALLLQAGSPAGAARGAPRPVALVYLLAGTATVATSAAKPGPLHLFDHLQPGATVAIEAGSRLALAFANGRRYELGEHAQARIGRTDLAFRSGPVRALPAVSPLPRLTPLASDDQPGATAAAVRIRGERIRGLYPSAGAASLAAATVLRFEPAAGAVKHRIEVYDGAGTLAFVHETAAAEVKVRAGLLRAATRYHWVVRTIDRQGPVATGEADFVTLPPDLARSREALRAAVERQRDASLLALLAEVDRSLGLLAEARQELLGAARKSPGDAALASAVAQLEHRLPSRQSP